jgi:alpha,alpha-trehalase
VLSGAKDPIRDFAFIADGNRGALIGPNGDVSWMCFPGWSDPAVFAKLLDPKGIFDIYPVDHFVTGGHYEESSLIWHSRWVTHHAILESRDALAYPSTPERAILLRRVVALEGGGDVVIEFAPAADYGRRALKGWRRNGDVFVARAGALATRLVVPSSVEVISSSGADGLAFHLKVMPGECFDFVAEFSSGATNSDGPLDAEELWHATEATWRGSVPPCTGVTAAPDVRRSLAVLRGMTGDHGGTVAAATTSLPERDGSDRNYDYRFCWVRDTCYVGQAGAAIAGGEAILDDAVRWVGNRLREAGTHTSPAYLGNGDPIFPPEKLNLPGYPGGTDVVGNRVREQFQLDLFGDSLLLFARAASAGRLDLEGWRAAEIALDAIEQHWDEPEAGIWELQPNRWTQSRLICVAGLRAISYSDAPAAWSARAFSLADHLLDQTNATSLHPSGRWQRAPNDDRVDAALLLAEIRGALLPSDPRSAMTRDCIAQELVKDHYLYRYKDPGDELGDGEGAFLICNFWMALAQFGAGASVESARWFERGRSAMSTTGLFSEEFDTGQHQLRGNLPQAFVHATLVEAAAAQGSI